MHQIQCSIQIPDIFVDLPLQSGFRDVYASDFDLPYTCDIVTSRDFIDENAHCPASPIPVSEGRRRGGCAPRFFANLPLQSGFGAFMPRILILPHTCDIETSRDFIDENAHCAPTNCRHRSSAFLLDLNGRPVGKDSPLAGIIFLFQQEPPAF